MRYRIFISSVQREFAEERRMLANYLQKDALFARFFDVFIFENLPAKDQQPERAYIEEVKKCDIFLILLGKEYGYEFPDGTSPTQHEYETATENNKYRLAFLSNFAENERHVKVQNLVKQIAGSIVYKIFASPSELLSNVYTSLINFLTEKGELRIEPFDKSPNRDAELSDISDEKIEWFVRRAKAERNFPLVIEDGKEKILTHLNLLNKGKITNAAILLFGLQPQRFLLTSMVKCAHFHGTRVEKPIPSLQIYKGNLFELVDQAVDFVLSKIDFAVGTRNRSIEAPTAYEIPVDVIKEAIVNAVAHRDYDSTASVQVMLFKDRLEIWNPGSLPPQLTIETLKDNHGSYPHNPLIADTLYYAHYIERMGTGIQDIVEKCTVYGLPEPQFVMRDGFVTTIYRKQSVAYEKVNKESGEKNSGDSPERSEKKVGEKVGEKLTDNQQKIIDNISENPYITIQELSLIVGISKRKIEENLAKLKSFEFIERIGSDKGGYWKINDMPGKDSDEKVTVNDEKVTEKVTVNDEKVTKNQRIMLDSIIQNPYITSDELAKIAGISLRKIKENISKLKTKGLLERIGPDKGGYWKINV
jgi:predicted HTH transcriptional regulator